MSAMMTDMSLWLDQLKKELEPPSYGQRLDEFSKGKHNDLPPFNGEDVEG